jgi:hypothetical protein
MVDGLDLIYPQFDEDGDVKPFVTINNLLEMRLADQILQMCDIIDEYYGVTVESVSKPRFTWYPEGYSDSIVKCDNSQYKSGSWGRNNQYDFSALIFLSDYNKNPEFDGMYEVYGGKLQFPNFDFSFNKFIIKRNTPCQMPITYIASCFSKNFNQHISHS